MYDHYQIVGPWRRGEHGAEEAGGASEPREPEVTAAVPQQHEPAGRAERLIPFLIGLGPFISYLDNTLANAVFPSILAEFERDVTATSWAINAANLALATGLVIGGSLADARGRRRIFLLGLFGSAAFAVASACAPGLAWLVVSRMGLGLAGALLLASSLALVASAVRPERQAAAVGLYAAIGGVGSLVGPVVGAASTGLLSWRWGFAAIAPIALTCAVLSLRWLPPDRDVRPVGVNPLAGVFAGLGIAGVLFSVSNGPSRGWSSAPILASLGGAAVLALAVLFGEMRSSRPLFPRALRSREYVRTLVGIVGLGFTLGVSLFAIPLFVTQVQGASFASGGIALAPAALVGTVAALVSGRLAGRSGYALPSTLGLTFAGVSLVVFALLGAGSGTAAVLAASAFSGIGIGMGIPAMAGGALAASREADAGSGSGWYHSVRVLGIALGVVAFATFATRQMEDTAARRFTEKATVDAPASERDLALRTFDRLRGCDRAGCVDRQLAPVESASPRVAGIVRAGMRRYFAERYQRAFLWSAGVVAACLLGWLGLGARRSAPGDPG